MKNQAKGMALEEITLRGTILGRAISERMISGKTISKRIVCKRTKNKMKNKKVEIQKHRKQCIICVSIVCSILMVGILFSAAAMNADAKTADSPATMYKYYASVQIMNGDSLWTIAEEYTDGSISEILHCIDEIKSINHLSRFEKIKAGEFLIVPYYSDDIF